jgi:hypothetical protein
MFSSLFLRAGFAQTCRAAGCNGMLPQSATLCCTYLPAARCNPILPFNSNGLDCQVQRSAAAAWRLRSEQQVVRYGLPVNRPWSQHARFHKQDRFYADIQTPTASHPQPGMACHPAAAYCPERQPSHPALTTRAHG